jgi:hypothetical protein
VRATVRLGEPHHDIAAAFDAAVPFAEHGVGLAYARGRSEVDPQVTAARPGSGATHRVRLVGAQPAITVSHVAPVSFF